MDLFFYADETRTPQGPVSLDELKTLVNQGTVKPRTFVIPEKGGAWQRWSEVESRLLPAPAVSQSLVPVTTTVSTRPAATSPAGGRLAAFDQPRRVMNRVLRITLYSGLIGGLITNSRSSLEQAMVVNNAHGWRTVQVMPHMESNLLSGLLRLLLLLLTLGMFTFGGSYLVVMERDEA